MKTNIEVRYAAHPDDVKHWDTRSFKKRTSRAAPVC